VTCLRQEPVTRFSKAILRVDQASTVTDAKPDRQYWHLSCAMFLRQTVHTVQAVLLSSYVEARVESLLETCGINAISRTDWEGQRYALSAYRALESETMAVILLSQIIDMRRRASSEIGSLRCPTDFHL
jgi:hypothetical protein